MRAFVLSKPRLKNFKTYKSSECLVQLNQSINFSGVYVPQRKLNYLMHLKEMLKAPQKCFISYIGYCWRNPITTTYYTNIYPKYDKLTEKANFLIDDSKLIHVFTNKQFQTYWLENNNTRRQILTKLKTKLKFKKNILNTWEQYFLSYQFFFYTFFSDIFIFMKLVHDRRINSYFNLSFIFKKGRYYINLQTINYENITYIVPGYFLKYFQKRKCLKKGRNIRVLMAKYLRKLLILSKINNLVLWVKSTPLFLPELLTVLNTPILHKFNNPFTGEEFQESERNASSFRFLYFFFIKTVNYGKFKQRRKGRIKRKITRKLYRKNKIVD